MCRAPRGGGARLRGQGIRRRERGRRRRGGRLHEGCGLLELREQDPNETSRARLMVLTREQERIDAEIAGLASDLISPVAMTELLISMLDKQEGLSLVSFENFPAINSRHC